MVAAVLQQPFTQAYYFTQIVESLLRKGLAGGFFCAAKRAMPRASIASVLVRSNSSSAKRLVRIGLSNATKKPALTK